MSRKITAVLLLIAILSLSALSFAESGGMPKDSMFEAAKSALSFMSQRDFEQALGALGAKGKISASTLKQSVDSGCKQLYGMNVQTLYAVAWRGSAGLFLAIPLEEPTDGYVDTIVYRLTDSFEFAEVTFFKWGDVVKELAGASRVKWLDEYKPTYTIFVD